ncbi:MAG: hypothetical protein JWM56_812 [Candidatus Peribacteria bacterium]|nr:hypothetical protein [Candidatus Peribacteria bacterium]
MSKRPAMLGSIIREIIAPVLRMCPPACGIVSIIKVDVSPDFSYATVYITALEEPKKAIHFLEGQIPRLQKNLGSLYRKKIPQLRFRLDTQADSGSRLDELLK